MLNDPEIVLAVRVIVLAEGVELADLPPDGDLVLERQGSDAASHQDAVRVGGLEVGGRQADIFADLVVQLGDLRPPVFVVLSQLAIHDGQVWACAGWRLR